MKIISFIKKYQDGILFCSVFLIALMPRVIELFSKSDYFTAEPATDYIISKHLVFNHQLLLTGYFIGGIGGILKGPAFNYLLAIPVWLGNGNPFAGRIFMFLFSIAAIIAAFFLLKKLFDVKTAFFASFVLSISSYLSQQAGRIWPPYIMPLFLVVFLYLFYKILEKKTLAFYWMALLLGFMLQVEPAITFTLTCELFFIGLYCIVKKIISVKTVLIAFFILVLTNTPLFIFDLTHNLYDTRGLLRLLQFSKNHGAANRLAEMQSHFQTFSWNFRETFSPNIFLSGIILLILVIGGFIYIKNGSIEKIKRQFIAYLLITPLFAFFLLFLYPGDLSEWWLMEISVFSCVLLGIILAYFWDNKMAKWAVILAVVVLFSAFASRTKTLYQRDFLLNQTLSVIPTYDPIQYVYTISGKRSFSLTILSYNNRLQDFEYLMWLVGHNLNKKPDPDATTKYYLVNSDIAVWDFPKLPIAKKLTLLKWFPLDYRVYIQKN